MPESQPELQPKLPPKSQLKLPLELSLEIPQTPQNVVILGRGAWGSALGELAARNGHCVQFWTRRDRNLCEITETANLLVSAISMKGVSAVAQKIRDCGTLPTHCPIVTATKGLDPQTMRTPSQILEAIFPQNPIVVLSGPNLSQEIEAGLPAATIVASVSENAAQQVQRIFSSDVLRVYTGNDPIGTELGGTLKNVMAIAAGVCDGLKLGTNAKSALMCRALIEIVRVGTALGAAPETFWGLSGLGDLLATCSSALSRNYRVGFGLALGKTLEQVLMEIHSTAEGVNTAQVLVHLARDRGIDVPIAEQVYELLAGNISPEAAVTLLMERDPKPEQLTDL